MNVLNKKDAIDSWNNWADAQKKFDAVASKDLIRFGEHIDAYNNQTYDRTTDYGAIKNNIQNDLNYFKGWTPYLMDVNNATLAFAANSTGLTGDSQGYADDALENMREYHTEMQNAQIAYMASCSNFITYLDSIQKGYPDDMLLNATNVKKEEAIQAIQKGTAAGNKAMDSMKRLQES